MKNILSDVRKVIRIELAAVQDLYGSVDKNFENAVKAIFRSKGKLIITGVGKSGLIAQKIAATMVSTGTLAIYMHPSEGLHGDLGIVRKNDIILAIGKSGESEELLSLFPAIKKIGARIIAITSEKNSSLARNSDIIIHTPVRKEACYLNLAPTSSTTSALVAGDALAVALMRLRNFAVEDFALYHPGGLLGRQLLLTVGDVMRCGQNNPSVLSGSSIKEMLRKISLKGAGAVSIVDRKKRLLGLVTDKDVRSVIEQGKNIFEKKISDIMNPVPTCTYPEVKASAALEIMENRKLPFTVLPVLDKKTEKVVGMVHLHDIISAGIRANSGSSLSR